MPKKREPIDDMIDAHVWLRAAAKRRRLKYRKRVKEEPTPVDPIHHRKR